MPTVSKLSTKCKKCPHVKNCDNKRMVACALRENPSMINNIAAPLTMSITIPILRDTSIQAQIAEQLKKDLYKKIFNVNCAFNKS
ncbi:hypothetical protein KPL47_06840 [Clostridium estertheticum]|uniref:hypothetical protein n=1 Tax=Clostridium estertheticum TaxID=238834 RepID=UPI001C0E5F35|nr:hypothetical protein [Clostridium estertheticum]MBU3176083.1 hypothetical protein [Clostridium estertheticum]